jgi:nicotinate-nucleotide adenylyltransferase
VPAALPAHRPAPMFSAAQRLDFLRLAVADEKQLLVDDRELQREGPSYTVDTLQELRNQAGASQAIAWVLGSDAARGLMSWHRWQSLTDLAHLIVLTRPQATAEEAEQMPSALQTWLAERRVGNPSALRTSAHGLVCFLEVTRLQISASMIRQKLMAGQSVRWLVPDALLAALQVVHRQIAVPPVAREVMTGPE